MVHEHDEVLVSTGRMNYRDFSTARETNLLEILPSEHRNAIVESWKKKSTRITSNRSAPTMLFPMEIFTILSVLEDLGLSHICSWKLHGRSFQVHDSEKFVKLILPTFSRPIKMTSFQKQLSLYGFRRVLKGDDYDSYYHELFLRGKPFLCNAIVRTKKKGKQSEEERLSKKMAAMNARCESPIDLFALPFLPPIDPGGRYERLRSVFSDEDDVRAFVSSVREYEMSEQNSKSELTISNKKKRNEDDYTYGDEAFHEETPSNGRRFASFCSDVDKILSNDSSPSQIKMTTPSNLRTNQENQVFCGLTRLPQEQRPISEDSNRNNIFGIGDLPGSDQSPTINEDSLSHLLIPTPIEAMDINDL